MLMVSHHCKHSPMLAGIATGMKLMLIADWELWADHNVKVFRAKYNNKITLTR